MHALFVVRYVSLFIVWFALVDEQHMPQLRFTVSQHPYARVMLSGAEGLVDMFVRYMKMDDDVFLLPSRLMAAAKQWSAIGAGYIGCMKKGPVYSDPKYRWHEPHHHLVGAEYFMHAFGKFRSFGYTASGHLLHRSLE
jgi:Galactosyltransferase